MLPGVITPVPLTNTPVRVALCPAVIVAELAVKLLIEAAGGGGVEPDEPPQPIKPAGAMHRAVAHVAKTQDRFISFPVKKKLVIFPARQ
jgi:hypothetical protein